jgi:hypothetical protein
MKANAESLLFDDDDEITVNGDSMADRSGDTVGGCDNVALKNVDESAIADDD